MKFAKELEQELVPEWRAKYLDYKGGKKKLKALSRALRQAHRSPRTPSFRQTPFSHATTLTPSNADKQLDAGEIDKATPQQTGATTSSYGRSTPAQKAERQPLQTPRSRFSRNIGSYGSIHATPPQRHRQGSDAASFELPDPALDPDEEYMPPQGQQGHQEGQAVRTPSPVATRHATFRDLPEHAVTDGSPEQASLARHPTAQSPQGKALTKSTSVNRTSQLMRRVFSYPDVDTIGKGSQAHSESDFEKQEKAFFKYLDEQLEKIDTFYQMKEQEAAERLKVLRRQLHIMRDQRIHEFYAAKRANKRRAVDTQDTPQAFGKLNSSRLKDTLTGKVHFGKNSQALAEMATPKIPTRDRKFASNRRDFMRRQEPPNNDVYDVSYRSAKRKLKHALQEFYRGIELLKGYAYLNRTAFRKINKKYDKVVNAPQPQRYMSEKVNKASFVESDVLETLMSAVEDLYARYFERGDRKIAASKLRHTLKKPGDYSPSTFRSGLLLMAGTLFGIQALVYATQHLRSAEVRQHVWTSYLLQIYGGYFLIVFHVLLFSLDCMVWTKSKINYEFVFEYDSRHTLEWRQLLEIPSFFIFLLGLFMWLNFSWINAMYIYWPVVLIGLTLIIIFLPARVLYHRSRKWWAFSNWRLLLAGIYPVEFRDFFLGDMYCSQVYAMGNIELFFCLYAYHWSNPVKCNSSHSRLLGFFTTLPAIWRAFQCIRRYIDTRNAFPHLLNLGKYIFTILYYATLSMYRIDRHTRFQAAFITFGLLNAVYTSVWDLIMDWSLGNPYAKHKLLREVLTFHRTWVYYVAMVVNVVIRFNWIFYAIFVNDLQHSAVLSFIISLSEVVRRGMWSIFRVENEHCTNVLLFRASRDVPLPYDAPAPATSTPGLDGTQPEDVQLQEQQPATPFMASADVETGAHSISSLRARKRAPSFAKAVGNAMSAAHAQDFQRRRVPAQISGATVSQDMGHGAEESSDEDGDDNGALDTDEDSGSTVEISYEGSQAASDRRLQIGRIVE